MESTDKLREGYTTGSCAAAAAKASAMRAAGLAAPAQVSITTPEERLFSFVVRSFPDGSCGVVKDAGDDPDSTDGIMITALVAPTKAAGPIIFKAGEGVGLVTLPGMKVAPGEPAINPTPRLMIERAVREILGERGATVTIGAPGGEERAKRTFNPRLGIVGGISILGTSGRVKPMDEAALLASYSLELATHAAEGRTVIAVAFAGAGEAALRKAYEINNRAVVQCGNYIGFVLDEAARLGFRKLLLCGHPGKLLKVAAGTFATHNKTGGGAKEALCTQCAIYGASPALVKELYECATTEAQIAVTQRAGFGFIWKIMAKITERRASERIFDAFEIAAAYMDSAGKILGEGDKARKFAGEIRKS